MEKADSEIKKTFMVPASEVNEMLCGFMALYNC